MQQNSSNSSKGKGNTKPSPKKQDSPKKEWCFTHNFEKVENKKVEETLINKIVLDFKAYNFYIFSLEIGEQGRRHLQGYVEFPQKERLTAVKKLIDDSTHWEKAKGDRQSNITYISKEPIKGPYLWDKSKQPKYTPKQLKMVEPESLFDFQKDCLSMARNQDSDRKIPWVFSKETGVGKTQICKHLMYYDNWGFVDGDKKDIMCAILGKDGTKELKNGYFFNFSNDKDLNKVSYQSMENMKDGLLFSSKYESGGVLVPPINLFVFANGPPKAKHSDRWEVFIIKDKKLIKYSEEPETEEESDEEESNIKIYLD